MDERHPWGLLAALLVFVVVGGCGRIGFERLPLTESDMGVLAGDGGVGEPSADGGVFGDAGDESDVGALVDAGIVDITCGSGTCLCPPGETCLLRCTSGDCDARCEGDCMVRAMGTATASVLCEGAQCVVEATGNAMVGVDCRPGSVCTADCRGASMCVAACSGASCLLDCSGASTCDFSTCDASPVGCGEGATTCDHSCP